MTRLKQNDFRINASLSQQVSQITEVLKFLAGTDKELSDGIAVLRYIQNPEKNKLRDSDPISWLLGLLDYLRLSALATSPTTNEVTKLGFMLPKAKSIVSSY